MKAPSLKPWVQRVEIEADGWSMLVCWYEPMDEPDVRPWWKRWLGIDKPTRVYVLHQREAHTQYGHLWRWYDKPERVADALENQGSDIVACLKIAKRGVWTRGEVVRCIEVGNGPYRRPPSGC